MQANHMTTRRTKARGAGFTIMELLVVMSIIILLVGMLVPAVNIARRNAGDAATRTFLGSIAMGMEAYHRDHGDHVPSDYRLLKKKRSNDPDDNEETAMFSRMNQWQGGEIMAQLLLGYLADEEGNPLDGNKGLGYRAGFKSAGRVYGPYLDLKNDRSLVASPITDGTHQFAKVITDPGSSGQKPMLYYRANNSPSANVGELTHNSKAIISQGGRFDLEHNHELADPPNGANKKLVMEYLKLLEKDGGMKDADSDALRTSLTSAQFLLLAPGPDDSFGTKDDIYHPGQ